MFCLSFFFYITLLQTYNALLWCFKYNMGGWRERERENWKFTCSLILHWYSTFIYRIYWSIPTQKFQPVDEEPINLNTLHTLQGKIKKIKFRFYVSSKKKVLKTWNVCFLFQCRETTCSLAKKFNCYVFEMRTNEEVKKKFWI